ncbi:MAG TPA: efflux RND transporter periplasmic adaptor subunit [Xanthobacteraceae bacterium]|nr:efflux RND transporter periplasmic adaptor subunit [Xanthobacteraceae bacterium]
MSRRTWLIAVAAVVGLAVAGGATRGLWSPEDAAAQSRRAAPAVVPVEVATAQKKPVPVTLDALGTVTPIASVAIKSRLETEIIGVHFEDGATVNKGDLLFTLDSRMLDAQIRQAEGVLARDRAQLEGAQRDLARFSELLAKKAGTAVNVENAQTQVDMLTGTVKADESALQNLRVQKSFAKIYAPISGRISAANVKVGNFVRPADPTPLATIVQTKPVYVTFALPQSRLPLVREAMASGAGRVTASARGDSRRSEGKLAMIENTVDTATGTITVRATMDNADEALWPGTLVNAVLTLRVEEAVTVPSKAVQVSQNGNFVFIVKDGVAEVRPVAVDRVNGDETVLRQGLEGGETVVTDGQLLLANGTKVAPRAPNPAQAGS